MRKNNVSTTKSLAFCCLLTTILLIACSTARQEIPGSPAAAMPDNSQTTQPPDYEGTLYAALGCTSGIELLTNNFLRELAADDRIRHRYKKTDIGRFHRMMQLQICELADGPCIYPGDSMKRTHGGMNIRPAEFNALVEALMRAMDTTGLNPGVQNRLLAKLAPMRADIVGQ